MHSASIFVNDIITEILKLRITSEQYVKIGEKLGIKCSRNIFYNCVSRNTQYMNYSCSAIIKTLILDETDKNQIKKSNFLKYLKTNIPEISNLINNNSNNLNNIIDFAINKFLSPDIIESKKSSPKEIEKNIFEISELYIKTLEYLKKDSETSRILLNSTIEKILEFIAEQESLKFIKSKENKKIIETLSNRNIIPNSIMVTIENLSRILSLDQLDSDFIELIYSNFQFIIKWFIKDYLNNNILFTKINYKSSEVFHHHDKKNIRVYELDELIKQGWSIKQYAQKLIEMTSITIDNVNPDNSAQLKPLIARLKSHPETSRLLLDNNNNVIGSWVFSPLFDKYFEKAAKGHLYIDDINPETMPILFPGTYNIHFNVICLKNEYRKSHVFNMLLFSIIDFIEKLAINEIFINKISTQACTKNGVSLAKSIGFKYNATHEDGHGDMYVVSVSELLEKPYLKNYHMLKKLYKKHYS